VTAVVTRSTLVRSLIGASAVAIAVSVASTALASKSSAPHMVTAATVQTRNVKGLGTILVNSKGLTLYMFVPDKQKKVTCKGSCAVIWPPLKVKLAQRLTAGGTANKRLLGRDRNPSGGFVATYNRWPLYTYLTDTKPGQVKGQALNNSGGLWYVLSPSGKIIKKHL
jgi:predicted lipoprotein with Yx(FWY)xxD motif